MTLFFGQLARTCACSPCQHSQPHVHETPEPATEQVLSTTTASQTSPPQTFVCKLCPNASFPSDKSLRKHRKRKHGSAVVDKSSTCLQTVTEDAPDLEQQQVEEDLHSRADDVTRKRKLEIFESPPVAKKVKRDADWTKTALKLTEKTVAKTKNSPEKTDHTCWKCRLCAILFESEHLLKGHVRNWHEKQRTCWICNEVFYCESKLQRHQASEHVEFVQVVCKFCCKVIHNSSSKKTVNRHIQAHNDLYRCLDCKANFRSQLELEAHISMHFPHEKLHFTKPVACDDVTSPLEVANVPERRRSMRGKEAADVSENVVNALTSGASCSVCRKTSENVFKLQLHYKEEHSSLYTHQCQFCGRMLRQVGGLMSHERAHKHQYQCIICKEVTSHDRRFVMLHMASAHAIDCDFLFSAAASSAETTSRIEAKTSADDKQTTPTASNVENTSSEPKTSTPRQQHSCAPQFTASSPSSDKDFDTNRSTLVEKNDSKNFQTSTSGYSNCSLNTRNATDAVATFTKNWPSPPVLRNESTVLPVGCVEGQDQEVVADESWESEPLSDSDSMLSDSD